MDYWYQAKPLSEDKLKTSRRQMHSMCGMHDATEVEPHVLGARPGPLHLDMSNSPHGAFETMGQKEDQRPCDEHVWQNEDEVVIDDGLYVEWADLVGVDPASCWAYYRSDPCSKEHTE